MKKVISVTLALLIAFSTVAFSAYAATSEPLDSTAEPTVESTVEPTSEPAAEATVEPTVEPTSEPVVELASEPLTEPVATEPAAEEPAAPRYIYASYKSSRIIGQYQDDGSILFIKQEDAHANANALKELIADNEKKTIVLPKETVKIDQTLVVGSNTTIVATGATVYETKDKAILLEDRPVSNVKIKGGKWLTDTVEKGNLYENTNIRFLHASNITIDNIRVNTSYIGHALEFIACKNCTVTNSKFIAVGKKKANSNEEAVQIDVAASDTAPSALRKLGNEYIQGQTCKNITVKNCVISGSRGICTNRSESDGKKWQYNHHSDITIENCKITGVTSEAVALHNALNVTVKNCKVYSKDKRLKTTYSIGINVASFGNCPKRAKSTVLITGNTVNAGRQGIYVGVYKSTQKFKSVTIKNNKKVCSKFKYPKRSVNGHYKKFKQGPANSAIFVSYAKKVTITGNKTYTKHGKKNSVHYEHYGKKTVKSNKAYKK